MNTNAAMTQYKNLILFVDIHPFAIESSAVPPNMRTTIPIASVGPANNGKM